MSTATAARAAVRPGHKHRGAMASLEQVTSADGTRIGAWRSGSGPALVLVHGTAADHSRWTGISPAFEKQFTVYAVDRRGRGSSGDAVDYSIEREGEDLAAVIEHVGGTVSLLGHSYGGLCSIEAALRTRRLHRLVLYEPPLPVGPQIVAPEVRARLDALIQQGERETTLLTFFREVVRLPEAPLQTMRASPAWAGRLAAAHTVAREVRLEGEYRVDSDRIRAIQTPTLLLLGGDSPSFFHEATRALDATLPNSRVHEMPGQQHVAMDTIPDEFTGIVSSFCLADRKRYGRP